MDNCDHCGKEIGVTEIVAEIYINDEALMCHVDCASEAIEDSKFEGSSWDIEEIRQNGVEITGDLYGALSYFMRNGRRLADSQTIKYDEAQKQWVLAEQPAQLTRETGEKEKEDVMAVEQLGERIGYGHLMCLASALWRAKLVQQSLPPGQALVPQIYPNLKKKAWEEQQKEILIYDEIVKRGRPE